MLKHIEEFGKFVEITGFRNIKIGNIKDFVNSIRRSVPNNVEVQIFNAELIATWQHLYFATLNALHAFQAKRNISKSLAVEIMLYAASERQIKKAMPFMGARENTSEIAVVLVGDKESSVKAGLNALTHYFQTEPDESLLELFEEKIDRIMRAFEITQTELDSTLIRGHREQAVVNAVVERVALLTTKL